MTVKTVYLASKSPRRKEILESLGLEVIVIASNDKINGYFPGDEVVRDNESPAEYVKRTAKEKFFEGLAQRRAIGGDNSIPVVAADTVVSIGLEILGKPKDKEEAKEFLMKLSGKSHEVRTAVVVGVSETDYKELTNLTVVTFAEIQEQEIEFYTSTSEPYDKAGGYGIQGKASIWISSILGSYSGVMGLPTFETTKLLANYSVNLLG